MKYLRGAYAIFMLVCSSSLALEAPFSQSILNYAQDELPNWGVLRNLGDFVYIDLDDEYIHKLISFIQKDGFEEPPYFGSSDLIGAHITVIYSDEAKKYGVKEIQEYGEIIHFTPKECKIVHPPKWQEIDEIYLIAVDAPELELIRKKYGLPKQEYDFHITIGVKAKIDQPLVSKEAK